MLFSKKFALLLTAQGGTIIIGIAEDEKHNPTASSDTGVEQEAFEAWEQSFRLVCKTKIRPVLHGIECSIVKHNGIYLISIEIPKSILRPHAFYDGNRDEFYIRYGNICNQMSYDDLKRSFTELESIQSKILSFRDNRLSMILNDEVVGDSLDQTNLVLHMIPHWSMGLGNYIDLNKVKQDFSFDVFSPTPLGGSRRGDLGFNTDGMIVTYGHDEFPVMSYSQLFHNGSIESVEIRMMNFSSNSENERHIHKWWEMEELIYKRINDFSHVLGKTSIPKPYTVFVSILNAKGKKAIVDSFGDLSKPLPREIIKSIPAYISEENSLKEALAPLFTSLANSFGMEQAQINRKDESEMSIK